MTPRERAVAARTLVIRLSGAIRLARLHQSDNEALYSAVEDVCRRHAEVYAEFGPLRVTIDRGILRVNDSALADLTRPGTPHELFLLRDELQARRLTALRLPQPLLAPELLRFLDAWTRSAPEVPASQVQAWIESMGVQGIALEVPGQHRDDRSLEPGPTDGFQPRDVLEAYLAMLAVADELCQPGRTLGGELTKKVHASIELMGALSDSTPELVLFATTYRDSGRYETVHAVNAATLSMLLARRLGLGHEAVSEIGRGALMMDLGMRSMSVEVRYHGGDLDEYMTREVLEHPLRSFFLGLPLGLLDPGHRAQLLVAWEHHTGIDGEGYPLPAPGSRPHLYSRLVAVCDAYDALVHDRGDRAGLARPLALEALYQEVDRRFDREVLYAFFEMMGRYPPGSVVRLSDGSVALVGAPSPDPRLFDRPELFVVLDEQGRPLHQPVRLDLGRQRGEHGGRITHTLDDRLFEESLFQLMF